VIGNTASPEAPPSNHASQLEQKPVRVKLSKADRRDIESVARLFLTSAVSRRRPERAWTLVSTQLRLGQTLDDWKSGLLPVEPYPVDAARWNLAYADRNEVGLDVWVASRQKAYPPEVFRLTFVRPSGEKTQHAWVVDSWTPVSLPGTLVAGSSPNTVPASAGSPRVSASASGLWILAPFVVLLLALLSLLAMHIRTRVVERRVTATLRGRTP
jgi:hypothetical protein